MANKKKRRPQTPSLSSFDRSSYDFLYSEFRHDDLEIRNMLRIKALLAHAALRIDGADRLSTVVQDQYLTPEETELLYELFENTPEMR